MQENPCRSADSEILRQAHLAPTTMVTKKHDYPCSCFRATTDVWTESKKTNKQTKNYRTTENTLSQKTLGSCWARAVLMSQYWKWLWLQHKIHGHHQPLNDQAHLNVPLCSVSRPKLSCNTHKLYSANGNIEAWNRYWSICVPVFTTIFSLAEQDNYPARAHLYFMTM